MTTDATTVIDAPFFLAGAWGRAAADALQVDITSPFDGHRVGRAHLAAAAQLEQAIAAAVAAAPTMRRLPAHQRSTILRTVSTTIQAQAEEFARLIAREAGKPITQARAEVQRSVFTFAQAAEEANRAMGDGFAPDAFPGNEQKRGFVRRFAIGPVAAITPYNFPLNLVAHKLAPAIAAGCPVVLKPAPQTPLTALKLAEVIAAAGLPAGGLSVLPLRTEDAGPLVEDDRFKMLTFTGSPAVGWRLKRRAGRKKVALELGGNAGVIVHHDADLARAIPRLVAGGFAYAGQSCISVQRIFVHADRYQLFLDQFVPAVQALTQGDPLDAATDLATLIDDRSAERVAQWLAEAQQAGAAALTGGTVSGRMVAPTVLVNAGPTLRVNCQEVFAPVVTVQRYTDVAEALAAVNASEFGLQAGVFTNDVNLAFRAHETLEVGGVLINEVPTWRVDHMPYGGVKQSGLGREGLRDAIAEMTEPRVLVFHLA